MVRYKDKKFSMKSDLAVITIHSGNGKDLERTLNSIDKQILKPNLNLVIIKEIKNFNINIYKKKYRKFILGKDRSIWDAMNIGIRYTKKYNIIFLNSGDTFYSKITIKKINKEIKKNINKVLIFKTILKYKNLYFYPKNKYFNNKNYSPHPSFVRPFLNSIKTDFFNEKNIINADGVWMKSIMNNKGFKKINKIISIYHLGGQSSNPSIMSVISLIKFHPNGGIKEIVKYFLSKFLPQKFYYRILYSSKFEIKIEK